MCILRINNALNQRAFCWKQSCLISWRTQIMCKKISGHPNTSLCFSNWFSCPYFIKFLQYLYGTARSYSFCSCINHLCTCFPWAYPTSSLYFYIFSNTILHQSDNLFYSSWCSKSGACLNIIRFYFFFFFLDLFNFIFCQITNFKDHLGNHIVATA